jgi:thiamine kinase-like enzyme
VETNPNLQGSNKNLSMKNTIRLSQKNLFAGIFFSILEKYSGYSANKYIKVSKSTLVKDLDNKRDTRFHHSIRVIKGKDKQLYVEKHLVFKYKNMKYLQFLNEIIMLDILTTYGNNLTISFPRLRSSRIERNSISMKLDFIKGKELDKKTSRNELITIIKNIAESYESLTRRLPMRVIKTLPKRTFAETITSYPIYLFVALVKDPKNISLYLDLSINYYLHVFEQISSEKKITYILAHRDLHGNNIIIKNKKIHILDNEISCLAEKYTDLAIMSRYYGFTQLLNYSLANNFEMKSFLRLSIYYTVQAIAFESKDNEFYEETKLYLYFLHTLEQKNNSFRYIPDRLINVIGKITKIGI